MPVNKTILKQLINLRHHLHSFPELSGFESSTSNAVVNFISLTKPTKIITDIGGYGLAAVFDSGNPGPTVLLRADMDALPIQETNTFSYCSKVLGVAHLCGHDGHTAILLGVAQLVGNTKLRKGRLVLLFQPAEETGQGAYAVINDPKFKEINPDYAFALHNLPGFESGKVFIRKQTFASASTGIILKLKGFTSHAAHPENGKNPDITLAKIIIALNEIAKEQSKFNDFVLLTIIHAKLGEVAFGTTPGNAVVMATLRTFLDSDMVVLKEHVIALSEQICAENGVTLEYSLTEEFPATFNSPECTNVVEEAARLLNLEVETLKTPFRWSEDFGHFSKICKSTFFGIGSGVNHPQLHNGNYDFPDEIIEPAVYIFHQVIKSYLE